jgi:hypothetical protein
MTQAFRIRVDRQSRWRDIPPAYRRACFEISLHNPACSGERLVCALEWAATRFSEFEFSLGDSLYVHNYVASGHPTLGKLDERTARAVSRREGDDWLTENFVHVQRVLGKEKVCLHRWDDWLSKDAVQKNLCLYSETPSRRTRRIICSGTNENSRLHEEILRELCDTRSRNWLCGNTKCRSIILSSCTRAVSRRC